MAKLTEKGWEKFNEWYKNYQTELERLRLLYNDKDYEEGWSIIDNYDYVKTLDDEVGLLIFGYDESIGYYFDEWEKYIDDVCFVDINGVEYTFRQVEEAVEPYYTEYYTED